jgi:predicted enzyme related to lactoylglutathione lyase
MDLAAVRIAVRDLPAACRFYEGVLELTRTAGDSAGDWVVFGSSGVDIVVERADADAEAHGLVGRFTGLSFVTADLDLAHERLRRLGARVVSPPQEQSWGGALLAVADPSDNVLHLVQYPHAGS